MCTEEDFKVALTLVPRLRRIFQDSPDPEDGVQETLLRIYLHRGLVRNLEGYVFAIARNVRAEQWHRRPPASVCLDEELPSSFNTEHQVDRACAVSKILRAVACLSSPTRRTIYLGHLSGETYKELSARTGLSQSMIKKHLQIAKEELHRRGIPFVDEAIP